MSSNPSTLSGSCLSDREEIDRCTEAFQRCLNRGQRPSLDEFLPLASGATGVLIELVHVELEFRLKHGEAARIEEYLERYPRLSEDAGTVIELALAEFAFRRRSEPDLRGEEFLQRFPDHRDALAVRIAEAENGNREFDRTLPTDSSVAGASGLSDLPWLPGYEIVSELGCGAMGVVYKARHLALNRIVALKMLHVSRQSDAEQRRRFRTEVESIARLQHPNIVQVHDVGEHAGRPFFTMEHLDGGSLAELCRGQAQAPRRAAEWVETLARAMHAVHAKGIVHRDLKPSNILLSGEWRSGSVGCRVASALHPAANAAGSPATLKIADFGLAHQQSSDLTLTGQVLGTPSYMAPEQAAGKVRQVSSAADIYALGAILYELLTGRLPFRGETVMEVIRQVQDSDPLSPRRLEPLVPRDLETICLKCLRKEPGQRYGSAGELADDLRRYLNGESIQARPPAWPERGVRWLRRHPAAAVVLAAVILAAIAVPLALLGHTLRLQELLDREQLALEQANEAKDRARRKEGEARAALYAADLKLAHNFFKIGDDFQIPRLLEPYHGRKGADGDPRGFEWGYLQRHGRKARPALAAHDGPLHLLAYGPDGRALVTAGGNADLFTLRVWDLPSERSLFREPLMFFFPTVDHTFSAYAPRGGLLAGRSKDGFVILWDFASRQTRFRFRIPEEINHLALSPDGRWLAVNQTRRTTLWDCATGQIHKVLPAGEEARLAFSPDGGTLLAAHRSPSSSGLQWWDTRVGTLREQRALSDGVVRVSYSPRGTFLLLIDRRGRGAIWSAQQGVPLYWSSELGEVRSLAVSEDERTLAAGDAAGRVQIWDIPSGQLRSKYHWQPNAIVCLTFAPDNRTLAAATVEGQVHQIDTAARHVPDQLRAAAMSGQALAWSADGQTVAAAARGGAAYLFDRKSGETRAVLHCPFQEIRCLAFAPDGRTLAVVCWEETLVRLWDTVDRRWRAVTANHPSPVAAIAFSADGYRLASLAGNTVRFWETETAAPRGSLEADPKTRALAFLPKGAVLITAGSTLQVWNVDGEKTALPSPAPAAAAGGGVVCLSMSRDGRFVAGGGEDGSVRLWKLTPDGAVTADKPALLRPAGGEAVRSLSFAADGKTLLVGQDNKMELWDRTVRRLRTSLDDSTICGAFSPSGSTLATVGNERVVRLWDPATWRVARLPGQALAPVQSLAFSADGRTLITAGLGFHHRLRHYRGDVRFDTAAWRNLAESLRFWDAATGQEQSAGIPHPDVLLPPHLIACSLDGRLLAAGGRDGCIYILDKTEKRWRETLFISDKARLYTRAFELARGLWTHSKPDYDQHSEGVAALAFSPDGKRLVAAGNRGTFRVFTLEDGKECCQWQEHAAGSPWLAFTHDGAGVAGSCGGQGRVWDAHTGELRATLGAVTDSPIFCGALAPQQNVFALGSKDGQIRLWDFDGGQVKRLPGGHRDRVTCLGFSPDGKTLASAGWGHTVRLWNLIAGREVAAFEGHKGRVNAVAFSPDGQTLASGGEVDGDRGEVLLWR